MSYTTLIKEMLMISHKIKNSNDFVPKIFFTHRSVKIITVFTSYCVYWICPIVEIHLGIMLNLVKHLEGIVGDDVDLFDGLAQDL